MLNDLKMIRKPLVCLLIALSLLTGLALADASQSETLIIHFLDVGQGDAIIVQCGGQTLMIDGGPKEGNQFVYRYLKETLNLEYIYDPNREHYKNVRKVRWTDSGERPHPGQAVMKVLTDITPYD